MGTVYLAEHIGIKRLVAIKVLHSMLHANPDAVERFEHEAMSAGRVAHPGVAQVYDFGRTADGLMYLAMEYIDGETLRVRLERETKLQAPAALAIVLQVLDALGAAHELGVVHRDLKPDNIMIATARDGQMITKVVDFGIARTFANTTDDRMTRSGLIVGTPRYMSPEQLSGQPGDHRSDIYSLGFVLFEVLTGKAPYNAGSAQENLLLKVTSEPTDPCEISPELSPELGRVVLRAMARRADQRFQSARDFGDALRSVPEAR